MSKQKKIATGIEGLDTILHGGFTKKDAYLVRGGAGSGKTTLGLHFLCQGIEQGEGVLLITLSEPADKIKRNALRRGYDLQEVNFLDLSPSSNFIDKSEDYNIFPSNQVEQAPLFAKITQRIKELRPKRVFLDGINQLRFLAPDDYQFRKMIQSLLKLLSDYEVTPLLVSEVGSLPDDDLQFLCDGVINLSQQDDSRKIRISKNRASGFRKGKHAYRLSEKGFSVYPIIKLNERTKAPAELNVEQVSSGIKEIDSLLHGGIERGVNTIITGPTGCGKTSLGLTFIKEAARQQKKSLIYLFEENKNTLISRAKSINIPMDNMLNDDRLQIYSYEQLDLTPEIFMHQIKEKIESNKINNEITMVMIDSITSFITFYSDNNLNKTDIIKFLHKLRNYLTQNDIALIMTNEIPNITGDLQITDDKISFLADNVILLRYLEINGQLKKAIGVLKKRTSGFENRLREFKITNKGIKVGEPYEKLRGILTGNPDFID